MTGKPRQTEPRQTEPARDRSEDPQPQVDVTRSVRLTANLTPELAARVREFAAAWRPRLTTSTAIELLIEEALNRRDQEKRS